jgi:hypothetical protein
MSSSPYERSQRRWNICSVVPLDEANRHEWKVKGVGFLLARESSTKHESVCEVNQEGMLRVKREDDIIIVQIGIADELLSPLRKLPVKWCSVLMKVDFTWTIHCDSYVSEA